MRTLILTAVMILIAVCTASAIKLSSTNLAVAPSQAVTISIDGLHRQVDAKSLPELKVEDLY